MPSRTPSRRQRLASHVAIGVVGVFAVVRFAAAEPRPWGAAVGWGVVTAVVLGPLAWLARDRVQPDRRETLTYVVFGGGILLVSLLLGVSLAFEFPLLPYGPGLLVGVLLGWVIVLLAERTVVPERLRGPRT